MRLTFLLSSLHLSGGLRDIVEYANRLAQRGHEVTLVTPGGTVDPDMKAELDPALRLLVTPVVYRDGMSKAGLAHLSYSMARTAPRSDIILSTHTPTVVAGYIATHIMRKGRPAWFYQDYTSMFAGRPVESWLMARALRWHKAAFVISAWAGNEIRAQGPEKIVVTGVGISHAEVMKPVPLEERQFGPTVRIMTLADMRPRKGMGDFLEAMAIVATRVPNLHLVIVSKDPCTIETDIPYTFIHRPSRTELAHLFQTSNLFVLASRWESLGLPPLEAMACATPVVLADSGGVRDYAINEENCLLTPVQNAPALADAVVRVLQDPALARRLSHAGPAVAARYDWEWLTDRFEQQLLQLHRNASPATRAQPITS